VKNIEIINCVKMKTTLLGQALPNVLNKLKEMLVGQGFLVQTIPATNPVLMANRRGSWFRKQRQLIIELSSIENNLTRVDITAVVKNNNNRYAETSIENSCADSIYSSFKKTISKSYGFR
jgi:hypothetical protein